MFNHPAQLAGVVSKVESAVERVYPSTAGPSLQGTTGAGAITADDMREHRERNAKAADTRKAIMRSLRVAKGISALHQAKFGRAGDDFAELIEDGGLGSQEGNVSRTRSASMLAD